MGEFVSKFGNPWMPAEFNITLQGAFVRQYGQARADQFRTLAAKASPGPRPLPATYILSKRVESGGPSNTGTIDGSSQVTPTGADTARALADVLSDDYSHQSSFGVRADGLTDDAVALNAMLAYVGSHGGGVVRLRGTVTLGAAMNVPSNVTVDGGGSCIVVMSGTAFRAFVMSSVEHSTVSGINFDLTSVTSTSGFVGLLQNCSDCHVLDCSFEGIKGDVDITGTSVRCSVRRCVVAGSLARGVCLDGVSDCVVSDNFIDDCSQFGVALINGAHHNVVSFNRCLSNGIELVGLRYDCHHNRIVGNHAEGTGDNGISVTGQYNVVVGNVCRYCAFNGIGVYGSHNEVTGNSCLGNGQAHLSDSGQLYAGIAVQGAFGGTGKNNAVVGNVTDDDQETMTQNWGILLSGANNTYTDWEGGVAFAAGSYCKDALNIYTTVSGGVAGSTPPTHTSGTVSDGGVDWLWVNSWADGFREPTGCTVSGNSDDRSITGTHVNDSTVNHYNSVQDRGYVRAFSASGGTSQRYDVAGIVRQMKPWSSSVAVKYGQMFYSSLGHLYRVTNVGGTTANEPTHTSGKSTGGDGIEWLLLQLNTREYAIAQTTNVGVSVDSQLGVGQIDKVATFCLVLAGNGDPNGVVSAPQGSTFQRADGGAGTTLYVRETGADTNWTAK